MTEDHPDRFTSLFLTERAKADFEVALRKGFWRSIWSWFTQTNNRLLPFDEIRKNLPIHGQHDIGMRQVELDKVVGSVGRYQDFDRAFLPRYPFLRSRWVSIDSAQLQDIDLPPIDVYKIGDVYFVRDGNHRVSVARQRGQAFIDANVVEIVSPIPITPDTNIDELIRQTERIEFFERTRLNELRPDVQIEFTLPGGFSKLLEHIDVHRWFMGEARQSSVPYAEAVAGWYDEVYLPMVQVIECNQILKHFPNRSEADLYIWIIEHLWYLRQEYQEDISMQEAARHYAQVYTEQPLRWLMDLTRWATHLLGDREAESKSGKE
jgi:hypothetical protein